MSAVRPIALAVLLIPALCATAAQARTESCRATTTQQIAGLFDRWNASLQTGEPKKVVANYADKSILLPTVSNKPRLTAEEKEDYFEHFLHNKPVGTIDSRTIEIDCNTAVVGRQTGPSQMHSRLISGSRLNTDSPGTGRPKSIA